jgi:protein-disulfide isomerase
MVKLRAREPARLVVLAALLLVVMLAFAACVQPSPAAPAATAAPAQETAAPTSVPATTAPTDTPVSATSAPANLPAGVDAEGDFYRGDPNAPVKLVEFSDFQ